MYLVRKRAYARAGLVGNPSDGYHGKTISIIVRNFWAEVVLYEWDSVDIVLAEDDRAKFSSVYDLARDVRLHGYYGGIRLINENFDTRRSIDTLPPWQIEMVDAARGVGATAKFAGSGGAIVGTYRDAAMFAALREELGAIGSKVLEPQIRPGIHDKT